MNTKQLLTTATLAIAVAASGIHLIHAEAPAVTKPAPKLKPAELRAKLKRDESALPTNSSQIVMSYADVAQKIMPSVVRITSSVPVKGVGGMGGLGRGGMDEEQLREFFRQRAPWLFPPDADPFGGGNDKEDDADPDQPRPKRGGKGNRGDDEPKRKHPSQKGVGSGVIITTDGFILTNNHVVADAEKIEVTVGNESRSYKATVIGTDPQTDVAVIKIEAANLPAATLGDASKLRVGDVVLAAGNPMELSQTLTQGIVSAVGRTGQHIIGRGTGIENFIQTDAAINPGNSGGPLVDALGRVVGINTAIMTQSGMSAGIGFSIPINLALRVGEDLVDDGKVTRGFLGIEMKQLTPESAKAAGLDTEGAVMVKAVTEGKPAQKAGVLDGDIIVSVDGVHTDSIEGVRSLVASRTAGEVVELEILRDGKTLKLKATLAGMSDQEIIASAKKMEGDGEAPKKGQPDKFVKGITIQDITPGLRDRYDIPATVADGAVIVASEPNTLGASAGLEEGDVIISINGTAVKSAADARKLAKAAEGGFKVRISRKGQNQSLVVPGEEKE